LVESGQWNAVASIPVVAPSRDFHAVTLQLEAMTVVKRRDPTAA